MVTSRGIALAAVFAVVACRHRPPTRADASHAPAVECMVYRQCGCAAGCAGTSVPRDQLSVGLTVPIVAGMACGRTARVETALGVDGHMVRVLGSAEACDERCGLMEMQAVDPSQCAGQCDRCEGPSPRDR